MTLPTRKHSSKGKGGITLVHDSSYEAAYSAFRQALQEHVGEGKPCWVDAEDIDIQTHQGDKNGGTASGAAEYKTTSPDGLRIAPKTKCTWTVAWDLVDDNGLPRTELTSGSITT